ncbi:MAG: GNAT family N-acetyltransferase [Solibacillus sp.]
MLVKGDDEFIIKVGGRNAARMQYIHSNDYGMKGNVIIITHTVVFETYKGKGYGRQLIDALVDYAREHDKKVEPQCPFAKVVFAKTPEIQDVLVK